jgi:hypothetical protein
LTIDARLSGGNSAQPFSSAEERTKTYRVASQSLPLSFAGAGTGRDANQDGDVAYPAAAVVPDYGMPPEASSNGNDTPANAIDHDIVSPRDLIRAVNDGNIAIKCGHAGDAAAASAGRVWLFDEAQGAFVAPDPEPLTIVIDHNDAPASPARSEHAWKYVATATLVAAAEPSWLSTLRDFSIKAARAVQQKVKWTG